MSANRYFYTEGSGRVPYPSIFGLPRIAYSRRTVQAAIASVERSSSSLIDTARVNDGPLGACQVELSNGDCVTARLFFGSPAKALAWFARYGRVDHRELVERASGGGGFARRDYRGRIVTGGEG